MIKLGAFGDLVLALGPMQAIREHHPDAEITLLTTAPFREFMAASPFVDRVAVDTRPRWYQPAALLALRGLLRSGFDRVYDLQTSDRSGLYFRLAGGRRSAPPWSGIAPGCGLPHADPARDFVHTIERQAGQLRQAGIDTVPFPDLEWAMTGEEAADRFGLTRPYAVILAGAAAARPEKRWPAEAFAEIARRLAAEGVSPALAGGPADVPLGEAIGRTAPEAVDLVGRTRLLDLPMLMRDAAVVVGNDTGPMHVAAIAGAPAVVLFSGVSDPAITRPRAPEGGGPVEILREPRLADLAVEPVWQRIRGVLGIGP